MAQQKIYQFYAELRDYEPRIWRRFQAPKNISIAKLGYILMTLFEMQGSHLFALETPDKHNWRCVLDIRYNEPMNEHINEIYDELLSDIDDNAVTRYEVAPPDELMCEIDEPFEDAAEARLANVLSAPGQRIVLNYDYGDGWKVDVKVEDIFEDKELPGKELPRVLEGKGFGIIEDCGGVGGLEELREAFSKKSGDAYKEFCEWLGVTELDLDAFDIDDMNFRLKKLPRIFKEIYEDGFEPSDRSMDIITRAYRK